MIITPIVKGNVAKNCHPYGIEAAIAQQIDAARELPVFSGSKKALVIGASSGYGLASRIVLAFNGQADTIGVSFEREPNENQTGSAGWYNNIAFSRAAEQQGLRAKNFIGDAFSDGMRKEVTDYIKREFAGTIDLVIYSLASGVRTAPDGVTYHSTLGVRHSSFTGEMFNIEQQTLTQQRLQAVTDQQLHDTVKVMGGEDWRLWIQWLADAGVLADGFKTVAFSYIGPESTYPLYRDGALGAAKQNLHHTADQLEEYLGQFRGHAYVAVTSALQCIGGPYFVAGFPTFASSVLF